MRKEIEARHRNEDLGFRTPASTIECVHCKNMLESHKQLKNGYQSAVCKIYPNPGHKPVEILFDNAKCEFCEKE